MDLWSFEASIKLPTGTGIWPAFWMLSTDEVYGGWPQSGEIDIMEIIGSEPDIAHGTIHFGSPWPNNRFSGEEYQLNEGIFNDQFHQFAVEWEAGEIRWFIDDYLYATKRTNDVSPSRWPFDQDFHFILNIAVGGNWPGSPNSTTSFPQTMEVEYVRVYDGFQTYINGPRKVANQAKGIQYTLGNVAEGSALSWRVPEGSTLSVGEDQNSVFVDWGDQGGDLEVSIENECSTKTIQLNVFVEGPLVRQSSFENFDDEAQISYSSSTGQLEDNFDNPDPSGINPSALVGKYTRDNGQQFDVLFYNVPNLSNVGDFLEGDRKFFLDVYTNAPTGTEVLLQLERKSAALPDNYPVGRHSRFQAITGKQNEWERLEFRLLDRPDGSVSNFGVDQFVFLFAPNSTDDNIYHFDNFDLYSFEQAVSADFTNVEQSRLVSISPNPGSGQLLLSNELEKSIHQLRYIDGKGATVFIESVQIENGQNYPLKTNNLIPGNYILVILTDDQLYTHRFVKQ